MTRSIALLTIVFLILANTGDAQHRTCRIVYPQRPHTAPRVAYLFDGSLCQRVWLSDMNFSKVIELPDGPLSLALTPNPISNAKQLPPNAPTLKLSKDIKDFYILISPDQTNNVIPIKLNLINIGDGKFDPGDILWFNLTKDRIFAKLNDLKLSVDPDSRKITDGPLKISGYYTAKFAYQRQGKGPVAPITNQYWWYEAKSRHLGFIVNSGGILPKIYFYCDFRVPKTTTPK